VGGYKDEIIDAEFQPVVSQGRLEHKEYYQPEKSRWAPYLEQISGNQESDKEIITRRKWLEDIFVAKGSDRKDPFIRQKDAIVNVIENRLLKSKESNRTRLDTRREEKGFLQALDIYHQLKDDKVSLKEAIDGAKSIEQIRGLKLISLALLDPHMTSEKKPWSALAESQKRMIRLGEVIGLEAERKHIELSLGGKRMKEDVAQRALNRYAGYCASADLPPTFYRRFKSTADKIRVEYGLEATVVAKTEAGRAVQVESSKYDYGHRRAPEADISGEARAGESLPSWQESVIERAGNNPEVGEKAARNFVNHFAEQLEYARGFSEKLKWYDKGRFPTIIGQINWAARHLARLDAHRQVFGIKGVWRAIRHRKQAEQALTRVRGYVYLALRAAAQETGVSDLNYYANELSAANAAVSPELFSDKKLTAEEEDSTILSFASENEARTNKNFIDNIAAWQAQHPKDGVGEWWLGDNETHDRIVDEAGRRKVAPQQLARALWNTAQREKKARKKAA